jgi:hypothetical protein
MSMEQKSARAERAPALSARSAGAAALFLRHLGVTAALAAVGYWPTRAIAGEAGTVAMLIGVGIALTGWTAGLGVSELVRRLRPADVIGPILTGMAARFMLTVTLLLTALLAGGRQWPQLRHGWIRLVLVAWVLMGYFGLLAIETASAGLRRSGAGGGRTSGQAGHRSAPLADSGKRE